jgi:hypothetical protein
MEPETEGHLVSDHRLLSQRTYQQIGMTFVGLCFFVGAVYVGYHYYAGPIIAEEQAIEVSDRIFAEKLSHLAPFTFSIVPNALEMVSVPELEPEDSQMLKTEFATARATLLDITDSQIENIYDLPVGDITLLEYLNILPPEIRLPLQQMQIEIETLVLELSKSRVQETLAERVGMPEALMYVEATKTRGITTVYPSNRVAEAHFFGEVLAKQFPSQASFFREYVDMYIKNGIAYGHYSALDARIAIVLVDDYLTQAEKNEQGKMALQALEQ